MDLRGVFGEDLWPFTGRGSSPGSKRKELHKMAKRTLVIISMVLFTCLMVGAWFSSQSVDPYSGVLVVQVIDGQGSCFVVAYQEDYWYAITAAHVANRTSSIIMVDDEAYNAEVVRVDLEKDVTLIRFKSPEDYKIYSFARAKVGESCTTVGWSRGSKLVYKGHVVSRNFRGFIVANGGIFPGCSGGVLLNEDNKVIGITVAMSVYGWSVMDSTALYVPAKYAEAMFVTIGD